MRIITEDIIDRVVERFDDSDAAYEKAVTALEEEQPVLMGYLFSEEFEAFTQDEREYLLMLAIITWTSVKETGDEVPEITEQALAEAEEQNWAKLEGVPSKHFNDRLDVFFDGYAQEDLLAFLEDALAEDEEDSIVTKEAREPIFVTLKSVVDCLTAA